MKKVVLKIAGIKDLNDSLKIEKKLSKNNSIKSALADHKEKSLTIKYKDNITVKEIESIIEQLGYKSLGIKILEKEEKFSIIPLIVIGIIIAIILYYLLAYTFPLPKIINYNFFNSI